MFVKVETTEGLVGGEWGPQEKGFFVRINGEGWYAGIDKPTDASVKAMTLAWEKEVRGPTVK